MAIHQNQTHIRSISLPSRLSSISTDVQNIKSLEVCATNSEAIQSALLRIAELYSSAEKKEVDHNGDEESLSTSVELLDACNAIRELIQTIKENVQLLQSAFRRKGMDSGVQSDIATYLCFRKRMSKSVTKTLKTLKQMMRSNGSGLSDGYLRELASTTMAIFKSILLFLSSSGGRSLVTKLVGRENDSGLVSEMADVDSSLVSMQKMRAINGGVVVDVQKKLQIVDHIVHEFEGGLERLFRGLLHIRVALLNRSLIYHC